MVYRRETVEKVWGYEKGQEIWEKSTVGDETPVEIIAMLGKGSGKNFITTISVAYIVHLLWCLKEPAKYFGKPRGDHIDIINIAVNAKQAKDNFFEPFKKERIGSSPWFADKIDNKTAKQIDFDKNIRVHSGHSGTDAWEGYNLIAAVMDEIAAFHTEEDGSDAKVLNADEAYDMASMSISSRFPEHGKLVLLSFPRYKGDFIQKRYDEVIEHKETEIMQHTFKMKDDMPDGIEGNEKTIEWEYDRIVSYAQPSVFAIRRTSWEVNPTRVIDNYKVDFWRREVKALTRFACMPPESVEGVFKDEEKIDTAFPRKPSPFDNEWRFRSHFKPSPKYKYYVHVDLAEKHDRAAVAIAHSPGFVKVKYGDDFEEYAPRVVVDAVRWWEAKDGHDIDFRNIRRFLLSLRERGFNIGKITFDQWQSVSMQNELRAKGVQTDTLSVGKEHYDDMVLLVQDERLHGYYIDILRRELLQLRQVSPTKYDHPPSGSKDLADAVCGASYLASKNATQSEDYEIEIDILEPTSSEEQRRAREEEEEQEKVEMPTDIAKFLDSMEAI